MICEIRKAGAPSARSRVARTGNRAWTIVRTIDSQFGSDISNNQSSDESMSVDRRTGVLAGMQ
jgi:hypothetical protein